MTKAPESRGPALQHNTDDLTVAADPRWNDAYACARLWVAWSARRRWPHHPANDDVWALSAASWWSR